LPELNKSFPDHNKIYTFESTHNHTPVSKRVSISEIVAHTSECLGEIKTNVAKFLHPTEQKFYKISAQTIIFDSKQCVMLTFRNITQIQEDALRVADSKMVNLMSEVSHEMITPIKCILALTEHIKTEQSQTEFKRQSELITVTAETLMNQVKSNLDRFLL
jgi:K+-sensing histidine kinase KdpD